MKNNKDSIQLSMTKPTGNFIQIGSDLGSQFISLPKLSSSQSYLYKNLKDNEKLAYILSFVGLNKKRVNYVSSFRGTLDSVKDDALASRSRPNRYYNLQLDRFAADKDVKPVTKAFHLGIEIECFIPYSSVDINPDDYGSGSSGMVECYCCEGTGNISMTHRQSGQELEADCSNCEGTGEVESDDDDSDNESAQDAGINAVQELIKKAKIKGCHVKNDSSIDEKSDTFACEISILTTDYVNLEKLCNLLKELGAMVNTSCGLHVHLDARNLTNEQKETRSFNLENSLNVLFKMLPKSRSKSTYCKKQRSTSDRYSAINMTALDKFGTIEIRMHSGTTDFDKIKNWCEILKAIYFSGNEPIYKQHTSVTSLCNFFNISYELKKYMTFRTKKFKDITNDANTELAA